MNVVKINSKDGVIFWVDEKFLYQCPNPYVEDCYNLINYYKIERFLHNGRGPSIITLTSEKYYYKGNACSKEEHNTLRFHTKLEDILDD